jgi:hypothetical protein
MRLAPYIKTAEPPPPEGVSAESWDKHLSGAKLDRMISRLINKRLTTLKAELVKKADGYRPSQLAESVGRAKGDDARTVPDHVAKNVLRAWGTVVSSAGDVLNKPIAVGRGTLIGNLPGVFKSHADRNRALQSVQHLKDLTPEDREKIESNLGLRTKGSVVGALANTALSTGLSHARTTGAAKLPPMVGLLAGLGLGQLVRKGIGATSKSERLIDDAEAVEFLQRAGVDKPLYAGKSSLSKSQYYPGTKDPVLKKLRSFLVERHLQGAEPGIGEKILREGGIIVPREKAASANWTALACNFN